MELAGEETFVAGTEAGFMGVESIWLDEDGSGRDSKRGG